MLGSRAIERYVPATTSTATSTVAIREKPRKAVRRKRRERAARRTVASATRPPTHSSARHEVEPVGEAREEGRVRLDALVPGEREPRGEARSRRGTPARAVEGRSRIHASSTSAVTTAYPSVIAMNASPNRVFVAIGERSP